MFKSCRNIKLRKFNTRYSLGLTQTYYQPHKYFWTFPKVNSKLESNPPEVKIPKQESKIEIALREAKDEVIEQQLKQQSPAPETPAVVKKTIWQKVKDEASHYWHGLKLLGTETSISSRLLIKVLKGNILSRREYRQLQRTVGDLLRLVPFIIILVIPFLEFALPVLLRFFPNMLPSTFESKFQEEEKKKNLLKIRIQMAKFLQETVGEVALSGTGKADAAKEFNEIFNRVVEIGTLAPTEDILRIARKFQDELTLNNLSRPQLVSMARYMNLNAFGTDSFLRHNIERRLNQLKLDDQMIVREGPENLSIPELQQACSARGIVTVGVSPARMRSELQQWLDLHLVHKIPSSLLLLSHAFQTTSRPLTPNGDVLESKAEALQATLSSLPQTVVNETQLKVSEQEGVATYKQKLEVIKEQEELIAEELEQDALQAAAKKAKEEELAAKKAKEIEEAKKEEPKEEAVPPVVEKVVPPTVEKVVSPEKVQPAEKAPEKAEEEKEEELSEVEVKKLAEALKTMTKESALEDVKQDLDVLKEDRQEFIEDVEELKQVTQKETSKSSDRLGSRVDKMIAKIESELTKYDSEIGSKLNLIKPNLEGQIAIQDLEEALRIIQSNPNDSRISKIVTKLDKDGDGLVTMNEILALAEQAAEKEGHGEILKSEEKKEESK
ncbi:hypothetical protein HK103_000260 [Boothiomyces macroporosus]|uniref:Mitochondrial proton/calcium exchanger protein n=1 Tax=Boothiomyces macroporosus TaxID=261099 RepID=A0AAD5UPY0_9FUNG|nr:hypothetical protein HK103_000260 [Boothiomyces macroporosus]